MDPIFDLENFIENDSHEELLVFVNDIAKGFEMRDGRPKHPDVPTRYPTRLPTVTILPGQSRHDFETLDVKKRKKLDTSEFSFFSHSFLFKWYCIDCCSLNESGYTGFWTSVGFWFV